MLGLIRQVLDFLAFRTLTTDPNGKSGFKNPERKSFWILILN